LIRGRIVNLLSVSIGLIAANLSLVNLSFAGGNASNPLAAVKNTDIRLQYFDLDEPERYEYFVDGAFMLTPKLKLKYELRYWDTDVSGTSESDWESLHLKPIYFPASFVGEWDAWKYATAIGGELIMDAGNTDKGIGSGSDQIAPLIGWSMSRGDTVLVPLIQHFVEFDGPQVNQTAFRLIGIQSLPNNHWGKLDAKIPVDWENDNAIPATAEIQFGKMFSSSFGIYADGLLGVGADRPYDWGVGVGLRFLY
jgi:hypothetical protein